MTDQVRTLREQIGQQSGFLSPALMVLLLAVMDMLPEEPGQNTRTLTAAERKQLKPEKADGEWKVLDVEPVERPQGTITFVKSRDARMQIQGADGEWQEIPLHGHAPRIDISPMPPDDLHQSVWDEAVETQVQLAAIALGVPAEEIRRKNSVGSNLMPLVGMSDCNAPEVRYVPPVRDVLPDRPDYTDGSHHHILMDIARLYFGPNPFYEYPGRFGVSIERIPNGVRMTGEVASDGMGRHHLGTVDFIRGRVGYANPETGEVTDYVALAQDLFSADNPAAGSWLNGSGEVEYIPWRSNAYCTPSRDTMTGGFGRTSPPFCECSHCRETRMYRVQGSRFPEQIYQDFPDSFAEA